MRVSPTITAHEMATILREALAARFGCGVDAITVTSHNARIEIAFDSEQDGSAAMVECDTFKHKTK